MNFIKINDNTGDAYFVNPTSIAYLKETPPHHAQSSRAVYKIVLKNDKQILVNVSDFGRVKQYLHEGVMV